MIMNIPVKTGIQVFRPKLDSRLRGSDDLMKIRHQLY
jgi:hypothetical protein